MERDAAETPQVRRVRDLAHEGLIAPAAALLEDHEPQVRLHRDGRTAVGQATGAGPPPVRAEGLEERGLEEEPVGALKVLGQGPHPLGQERLPERVRLAGFESPHGGLPSAPRADSTIPVRRRKEVSSSR